MSSASTSSTSPRKILLYVGIAVAIAAVLFAAFGMGGDDAPSLDEIAGSPEIEGDALPPAPEDPSTDPAVGSRAPLVRGAGYDGQSATIGDGDDELIVFLASWCPACQQELPELVDWLDAGNLPDGVKLTAVSTGLDDNAPNWPPNRWLEREGFEGPVIVDDAAATVAHTFGMTGTPFWVALDDGEVVMRAAGRVPMEQVGQVAQSLVSD